jgi:hypothetical protein
MSTHTFFAAASAVLLSSLDPGCFSGSNSAPAPSAAPSASVSLPVSCSDKEKIPFIAKLCEQGQPGSPCTGLPKEFNPGCIASCIVQTCTPKLTCADVDAASAGVLPAGASCADLGGCTFWNKLLDTGEACASLTGGQQSALGQCVVMVMEQSCPALVGSGWTSKLPGLTK